MISLLLTLLAILAGLLLAYFVVGFVVLTVRGLLIIGWRFLTGKTPLWTGHPE